MDGKVSRRGATSSNKKGDVHKPHPKTKKSNSSWIEAMRRCAKFQRILVESQLNTVVFTLKRWDSTEKKQRFLLEQWTRNEKVQELFRAFSQIKLPEEITVKQHQPARTKSSREDSQRLTELKTQHAIGLRFNSEDLDDLTVAASCAAAAYELIEGLSPPAFFRHLSPGKQPLLCELLSEDPTNDHLVDFQFSRAPNAATFYIMLRMKRKEIVLSFRGTQEFGDLLTDLTCTRGDGSTAEFHSGAQESVKRDYERMEHTLLNLAGAFPEHKILIVGHSLGGGLAVTFSLFFMQSLREKGSQLLDNVAVVTFGAMASVTKRGAAKYAGLEKKVLNVMSPRDPVPHLVTPFLSKMAENTPGSPAFFKSFSFNLEKNKEQEKRIVEEIEERPEGVVRNEWHWSSVMEKRVISMAFLEDDEDLTEEKKKKLVGNVLAALQSGGVIQNKDIPILHQFGRPVSLLRNASNCIITEVPTFEEVIYAHMALSGYVEEPTEREMAADYDKLPLLVRMKRRILFEKKRAAHHMKTIPEMLMGNLEFHSIIKYQESLRIASMYEDTLKAAEDVFLR